MNKRILIICLTIVNLCLSFYVVGCSDQGVSKMENKKEIKIIFLHHSTGQVIWDGGLSKFARKLGFEGDVKKFFKKHNAEYNTNYIIAETYFPKSSPYGWNNYPYDYYNIWVKNAGNEPYKEEPTLEMLTGQYDVIIFKHCFPISRIQADGTNPELNSDEKTVANYKLQYEALKKKMNGFPNTKFILWTPTALVEKATNKDEADRAREFSEWVKNVWDTPDDNIFLWDFRSLQSEDGLYFRNTYSASSTDSHPNRKFSQTVAPYFCNRIINVIEGNGDETSLTGK